MKKQLLFLALVFCLSPFAFPQEYGWQDISDNIPQTGEFPPNLSDVFFVSDDEGWITSNFPDPLLFHTNDGGETFEVQTTLYGCNAIHMLNENKGYAGGASGFVYRTTDGGESWTHHGSIGTTLADISFPPNSEIGYCCGINGNIWTINTSGVTKMNSGVPDTQTGISFPINSDKGWVCGGSIICTYTNGIWGGAPNGYPSGGYNAIFMVDTLSGWTVGDEGIIIHTTDGMNWVEQENQHANSLFGVFYIDLNNGWAIGSGGSIVHTNNGGVEWAVVGAGLTSNSLTGVHFTSTTNGYVVGNGKTLLKYAEVSGIGERIPGIAFELFPNPCRDKFEVRSAEFGVKNSKLELYDLSGKKLLEENIEKGMESIEIDASQLESGMYLCKITIGTRSSTKKIVKE